MIRIFSDTACQLCANKDLVFLNRLPIDDHEMIEETEQNSFFLCFQVKIVYESYGLFQNGGQIVVD
jgi:hypothetical protein